MEQSPRQLELLAPARDARIAIEAIKHGADAVYIGGPGFGARAAAGNSLTEIARAVDYAHQFGAKVYITVNTIIYDSELRQVERLISDLYRIGVDALIVQDMGILRLDIPPIALHASTQCDTRTPSRARFLQDVGFSQIVLARELSLSEIRAVASEVSVPIEVFVHGALCVSYSGDCHASCLAKGRSANRGECAQICRLPYDLTDSSGRILIEQKHLLSLRDLNQSAQLAALADAGASSFKIEGRLKDASYVKNTVAYYRHQLDTIINASPDRYCRASHGDIEVNFTPALDKSFNRGFTNYFLLDEQPRSIASVDTPKSQGEKIGIVTSSRGNVIEAKLSVELSNGDGLGFFNEKSEFCGFRLNRVDGHRLYPASPVNISRGTTLYRNKDKQFDDILIGESASRTIPLNMTLRHVPDGIALDISNLHGTAATTRINTPIAPAKTPQQQARLRVLSKLGGTIYRLNNLDDRLGDTFIAASVLADLRRSAIEALQQARQASHSYDYRRSENLSVTLDTSSLSYHANVSNSLADKFYRSHGASDIEPALETSKPSHGQFVVMTTRYCLRRELGCCLKTPQASRLPRELFLSGGNLRLSLKFDCRQCRMKVIFEH